MIEDIELLALAEAIVDDRDLDWIVALALAHELLPDLGRTALEWDIVALLAGNRDAVDVTAN